MSKTRTISSLRRRPRELATARLCRAAAAAAIGAEFHAAGAAGRGRPIDAKARQLAIYLQHVAFGSSISACAAVFARDRSTIRHACARIEDARDDASFDAAAQRLEAALREQSSMVLDLMDMFGKESRK